MLRKDRKKIKETEIEKNNNRRKQKVGGGRRKSFIGFGPGWDILRGFVNKRGFGECFFG